MTTPEEVACPSCKSDILLPPATRTISILIEPGAEPIVDAPEFLTWEIVAFLERALEQARDAKFADDETDDEDDDDDD